MLFYGKMETMKVFSLRIHIDFALLFIRFLIFSGSTGYLPVAVLRQLALNVSFDSWLVKIFKSSTQTYGESVKETEQSLGGRAPLCIATGALVGD